LFKLSKVPSLTFLTEDSNQSELAELTLDSKVRESLKEPSKVVAVCARTVFVSSSRDEPELLPTFFFT
jgi:hypothetical protein